MGETVRYRGVGLDRLRRFAGDSLIGLTVVGEGNV